MNSNSIRQDFNIVVTEFPKSGGTWLTALIGTSLGIPKRDLYVTEESIKTPLYENMLNHHWYSDNKSVGLDIPCVVKSHEFPNSPLINFNSKFIHLLRDGRDVAVSRYFFEKDFYVKNKLTKEFTIPFEDFLIKMAYEWQQYVTAWLNEKTHYIKYEDLLTNTKRTLINILDGCDLKYDQEAVNFAIADNTKKRSIEKLNNIYKHNTFVRKGIQGDWKNHFTKRQNDIFMSIAGDLLIELKYVKKKKVKIFVKKIKSKYWSTIKDKLCLRQIKAKCLSMLRNHESK